MNWITTTDKKRLMRWERIFASDRLPVKTAAPRVLSNESGDRLAYDLDASRLHEGQIARYAAELSRRDSRLDYGDALYLIRAGQVTIPAEDTVMIQETAKKRPFLGLWERLRRPFFIGSSLVNRKGAFA